MNSGFESSRLKRKEIDASMLEPKKKKRPDFTRSIAQRSWQDQFVVAKQAQTFVGQKTHRYHIEMHKMNEEYYHEKEEMAKLSIKKNAIIKQEDEYQYQIVSSDFQSRIEGYKHKITMLELEHMYAQEYTIYLSALNHPFGNEADRQVYKNRYSNETNILDNKMYNEEIRSYEERNKLYQQREKACESLMGIENLAETQKQDLSRLLEDAREHVDNFDNALENLHCQKAENREYSSLGIVRKQLHKDRIAVQEPIFLEKLKNLPINQDFMSAYDARYSLTKTYTPGDTERGCCITFFTHVRGQGPNRLCYASRVYPQERAIVVIDCFRARDKERGPKETIPLYTSNIMEIHYLLGQNEARNYGLQIPDGKPLKVVYENISEPGTVNTARNYVSEDDIKTFERNASNEEIRDAYKDISLMTALGKVTLIFLHEHKNENENIIISSIEVDGRRAYGYKENTIKSLTFYRAEIT